jgi:hypothetical protein
VVGDAADPALEDGQPPVVAVAVEPGGDVGGHPVPAYLPGAGVRRQEAAPLVEVEPLPEPLGRRPKPVDHGPPVDALPLGRGDLLTQEVGKLVGGDRAGGDRAEPRGGVLLDV